MDTSVRDSTDRDRDRSRRSERTGSRFDNKDRSRSRDKDSRSAESRRIYVSNIAYEVRWQDLKDLFRREVGEVAFVELFNDESGKPRGCGIVEFVSADSVNAALDKMNRYELNGRSLVIKEDSGNDRDKYGYVIKPQGNYSRRDRDDDRSYNDSSSRSHGGGGGGNGSNLDCHNTYGLSVKFLEGLGITQGPLHNKVFVANLDYKVDAKKLKQVFKLAGKVISVDLSLDKDGNSRGFAVVEYDHPVEAVQAISMFDRQILYDRRMTVRLDRIPDKSEGIKLPEGLKAIGIGLGPNGEPLRDVARNLPNLSSNNQSSQGLSNLNTNINPLTTLGNSLSQLNAPTPVAAPQNSSLLGVPANTNSLSGLAALSNVVAASLNSLGINLGSTAANDVVQNQNQQNLNQSSFNAYNTSGGGSGYNSGNRNDDLPSFGGSQIRNYNTSNDDYNNSRNFGSSSVSRKQPSDTILVRNLPSSWTWQNLRDKFRDVGEVKFAEIRGLDTGVVRFSKEREAEIAIKLCDGSRFDGRVVEIDYF
ncbi:hypothetical protein PVAND_002770 [Polypedilum vanderplanki]|uniref:RRM domain-containing protein n=1 Tax=Polypedilum vanderplanki TaxID=319348 RepID=A0A9J6BSD6_POLVA|nr:hypothetical protein PVAND_002770 [Polypedilum vanderplanki]